MCDGAGNRSSLPLSHSSYMYKNVGRNIKYLETWLRRPGMNCLDNWRFRRPYTLQASRNARVYKLFFSKRLRDEIFERR